jgi:hypothetical protein
VAEVRCGSHHDADSDRHAERLANARLIAAAPAMLDRYRLIAKRDCVRATWGGYQPIPGELCTVAPCDPCFARALLCAVEG